MDTRVTSVVLPLELHAQARRLAKQQDRSMSSLVRELLRKAVADAGVVSATPVRHDDEDERDSGAANRKP